MGLYMNKLYEDFKAFIPMPIFPYSMLPVKKQKLKTIGFKYAKSTVREYGKLKRYQQYGALNYTSFLNITDYQWDYIINTIQDAVLLYDIKFAPEGRNINDGEDFKDLDIELPDEYKNILDKKYK